MGQRKPYNPNTPYGRRKIREEHERWKQSLPPEEREKMETESNLLSCLVIIIIVVIAIIIGAVTGNMEGVTKWLSK